MKNKGGHCYVHVSVRDYRLVDRSCTGHVSTGHGTLVVRCAYFFLGRNTDYNSGKKTMSNFHIIYIYKSLHILISKYVFYIIIFRYSY